MPKRKHWATRLKEKNARLETENQQLREQLGAVPRQTNASDFSELSEAIRESVRDVDVSEVANLLLNKVCIPLNCREDAFIMETGETVRAQPFRTTDKIYSVPTFEMLQRVLRETQVDAIKWQRETMDCEKIARLFTTRCCDLGIDSVGRVCSWSGGHAFCVAIVFKGENLDVVFIEPQTDEIITELTGKYDLTNAFMLLS